MKARDWIAEFQWRAEMLPMIAQMIDSVLFPEERERLRKLHEQWPDGDAPEALIRGCLDMPLYDPRRGWLLKAEDDAWRE